MTSEGGGAVAFPVMTLGTIFYVFPSYIRVADPGRDWPDPDLTLDKNRIESTVEF